MAKFLITNDRGEDGSSVQKSQWDDTQVSVQNDVQTPQSPAMNPASSVFADADFHADETQEPTDKEVSYDVPEVEDDTSRIDETQEPTDTEKPQLQEDTIPNIYIQNDTQQKEDEPQESKDSPQVVEKQVVSSQESLGSEKTEQDHLVEKEQPTQGEWVDLDALFDDTPKKEQKPTQEEVKPQLQPEQSNLQMKDQSTTQPKPTKPKEQAWSIQRYLIAAGMLVAWWVILFFLFKMMFPLGINPNSWSPVPPLDNTIVFDTGDDTQHSVATGTTEPEPEPTLEEIREDYIFKLEAYAIQWEEYTAIGRSQRDNDILKYGLYIHKKSLDALDTLALSDDIDTTKLQALFDTFDTYIAILEWWNDDSVPPIKEPESITQPTTQETDTGSTTTWSAQTGIQDTQFGF